MINTVKKKYHSDPESEDERDCLKPVRFDKINKWNNVLNLFHYTNYPSTNSTLYHSDIIF